MTENQQHVLDIYKIFSVICEEKNIQFWATGGTVLGAIRHQGFIPWDDDIDVAVSRKDFEILKSHAKEWFPDYLELHWSFRSQTCRLIDTRWNVSQSEEYKYLFGKEQTPRLFIDVQPFDGTPQNIVLRWIHSSKVFFWRSCLKMKEKERIYRGKRPLKEKFFIAVFSLLHKFIVDKNVSQRRFDKLMKKYEFESSLYVADYVGKYFYKDVYPKEWWFPTKLVKFENVMIPIPGKYDKYLTQVYGEYMKIPKNKDSHFLEGNYENKKSS